MQPRILIAEDDTLQGAVLLRALERRGYAAEIVTDGLQAVRLLHTGSYDLALLDYNLPEIDGLAAARILRDALPHARRPYMIAITATAEGLEAKEALIGASSFDAIVSKQSGLPVLLDVIDANVAATAARHAGMAVTQRRVAVQAKAEQRRRHWLAPLAALPGAGVAAAFVAAILCGTASLQQAGTTLDAAQRTVILAGDTADVLDAVQAVETSGLSYVATRSDAARSEFMAGAQHIDRMLVSPALYSIAGALALEAPGPQAIVVPHLQQLAQSVRTGAAPSPRQTHEAWAQLRAWASALVTGSQAAVFSGLGAMGENIRAMLAVLGLGVMYAAWNAGRSAYRFWHGPRPAPGAGPAPRPVLPPRITWTRVPRLH